MEMERMVERKKLFEEEGGEQRRRHTLNGLFHVLGRPLGDREL
jgi:hypothetical protein